VNQPNATCVAASMKHEPEHEPSSTLKVPTSAATCGCTARSRDPWAENLGPADKVAEALSQWLGSIDFDEVDNL
jgi:hypothetical protein